MQYSYDDEKEGDNITNYVRNENVFEIQTTISCESTEFHSVIINPNNMNILYPDFPASTDPKDCIFYEGIKISDEQISETEPITHNRSHDKSIVTFKHFSDKNESYATRLFDWNQYLKLSKLSPNESGQVLNKNKICAFMYKNEDPDSPAWDSPLTILWNEYS